MPCLCKREWQNVGRAKPLLRCAGAFPLTGRWEVRRLRSAVIGLPEERFSDLEFVFLRTIRVRSCSPMDDLSEAFKALGHPHRLALVRRLIDQAMTCDAPSEEACALDPACCDFDELAGEIGVGKSTVSHHLKVLRQAGLVEREQEGRRVFCRINRDGLEELRSFLAVDRDPARA